MTATSKPARVGDYHIALIAGQWHVLFAPDDLPHHFLSVGRFQDRGRAEAYAWVEDDMQVGNDKPYADIMATAGVRSPPVPAVPLVATTAASAAQVPSPAEGGGNVAAGPKSEPTLSSAFTIEAPKVDAAPAPAPSSRDRILDDYAETGDVAVVAARAVGLLPGAIGDVLARARSGADARVKTGDAKRDARVAPRPTAAPRPTPNLAQKPAPPVKPVVEPVQKSDPVAASTLADPKPAELPRAPAPARPAAPPSPAPAPVGPLMKDHVLNEYARTGGTAKEIAASVGSTPGSVEVYLRTGRADGDPRVKAGALKSAPASSAQSQGRPTASVTPQPSPKPAAAGPALPAAVRETSTTAAPLPKPATPAVAGGAILRPGAHPGDVVGPAGSWAPANYSAKALLVLADGQLRGTKQMAAAAGVQESMILANLDLWRSCLRKIGIDLVYTKGIGCKLNPIAGAAA